MKNRGSTPILTNAVGVHPRNIHTKFEANPCSGLRDILQTREGQKLNASSRRQQRQRRQRQRRRRRRTQPDRNIVNYSLSVTNKYKIRHANLYLILFKSAKPKWNEPKTGNAEDLSRSRNCNNLIRNAHYYFQVSNALYCYNI